MTGSRKSRWKSRRNALLTGHWSLVTLFLLTGCNWQPLDTTRTYQSFYGDRNYITGTNYLTFEHAFTDAGAADAKRRADMQCAQRKRVAVSTERQCTLALCRTSFQCMRSEDAEKYQAEGGKP